MSKKSLLNEAQVRQFMKLARLEPLTPGFVEGLTETSDAEKLGESHGRGRGEGPAGYGQPVDAGRAGNRLREADEDEKLHATEDELSDMDSEADREHDEIEDLEGDLDAADAAPLEAEGPSEEELLAALQVIAQAAGLEGLDMDVSGDPAPEEDEVVDVAAEEEFAPEGDEVVADDELEMELAEGEPESEKKWGGDKGDDRRRWNPKTKTKQQVKDFGEAKEPESEKKWGGDAGDDRRRWNPKTKTKQRVKDFGESTEATDDLVEQITKRVAARILKSALAKK